MGVGSSGGGGGGDHAGLRTQMKPRKIDKSAINLLPLATLPYNTKVFRLRKPLHAEKLFRLLSVFLFL